MFGLKKLMIKLRKDGTRVVVDYRNQIIEDYKLTIDRLQNELKNRSEFEFKLMEKIVQLTPDGNDMADNECVQNFTDIYLEKFKVALTALLISCGFSYDVELNMNNCNDKKFFAFKLLDTKNEIELLQHIDYIYNLVYPFIEKNRVNRHVFFKIEKLENLHDKDDFTDLVRGIVVMRYKNEA